MNQRFLVCLKFYSINSLMVNLNDMITCLFYFIKIENIYRFNGLDFYENSSFVFYYTNFYLTIWSIVYTFGGFMDIYIIYGRIQIFYPKLTFLKETSISMFSFIILIFCILINIPINMSRQMTILPFSIYQNKTTILFTPGI
jgi:hypothetical protein